MNDNIKDSSDNLRILLQQVHDRLSLAVDAAGIGFWDRNFITGEVYYDEQWMKMLGFKSGEIDITYNFWQNRIHPDDKPKVLEAIDNHTKGLTPTYKSEHRLLTRDGNYIWVMDSGRIIERDVYKKPIRIGGITIDITERIMSQQRIRESEEKFKSIFEHLNDAFCRFTFAGQIIEVNKNLCDLLGIKSQELLNSNIKLFFNNKNIKYLHRNLANLIEHEYINIETEIITPKRKILPICISARLITSAGEGQIQALIRDIAERKNYEKALYDEKQKFKALIEHSPNVIVRFGRNLKCQYASPNMLKIMGINSELCIGKKPGDIFFPESLVVFLEEKMKWVIKKNKELSVNFSMDSSIGLKHFEAVMVPETNSSGQVESVLLTTSDITEKVNHERELNYSKRQLEEAEKNVHFGIYEIDLITNKTKWSNETYVIFEHDSQLPSPTIPEYFNNYVHPNDIHLLKDSFLKNYRTLSNFNVTYRINTPSGRTKYLTSTVKFEANPITGKALKIHGTIMDITEKKLIEDRLFSERDMLQIIMDNVPDSIYFKDNQGRFIRANKSFAKLLGHNDPETLIGTTVYDHFPKDIADQFNQIEQTILQSGNPVLNREREITTSYGNIWLSTTLVGIKDLSGQVTQLVGISRDITQYKHSEEQLRTAKEKAEQADKLKSTFLANMSHEIRTPINGILGFANLMEMREFPREKEIQYLQIINNSGKLLLNLINDIIDIAKIEAGEINIESASVDLNILLNDLLCFYQGEKIRRNKYQTEIKINIPPQNKITSIKTDPFRLRQIINNLISNSLKFTEKGCVEFGYNFEKSNIIFFVKDTGIGMTEEEASFIFERFKQAGSTSKKKEGTGLGLAISKGLVELLGGKIWVNSSPNNGTEFYFTLPVSASEEVKTEYNSSKPSPLRNYNWNGKTVLLVEDEDVNFLYINELLDATGVKLLRVITAEEAIQFCKSAQPIDLILMDIRLPGINGFEATRLIKSFRKDIPIIAQTAYAMENERKQCLEAGCDYYMTKPFDLDILFDVLNSFLKYLN